MANINTAAILLRVKEVLRDGLGSLRTITASTYEPGIHGGQTEEVRSLQGLVSSPRIEARIVSVNRSPASPSVIGNRKIDDVLIEVLVVRGGTIDADLDEGTRRVYLRATAAQDVDVIEQALTWPGNLTTTNAGTATGLCSGCLYAPESEISDMLGDKDKGWYVETRVRLKGTTVTTTAVS